MNELLEDYWIQIGIGLGGNVVNGVKVVAGGLLGMLFKTCVSMDNVKPSPKTKLVLVPTEVREDMIPDYISQGIIPPYYGAPACHRHDFYREGEIHGRSSISLSAISDG